MRPQTLAAGVGARVRFRLRPCKIPKRRRELPSLVRLESIRQKQVVDFRHRASLSDLLKQRFELDLGILPFQVVDGVRFPRRACAPPNLVQGELRHRFQFLFDARLRQPQGSVWAIKTS